MIFIKKVIFNSNNWLWVGGGEILVKKEDSKFAYEKAVDFLNQLSLKDLESKHVLRLEKKEGKYTYSVEFYNKDNIYCKRFDDESDYSIEVNIKHKDRNDKLIIYFGKELKEAVEGDKIR